MKRNKNKERKNHLLSKIMGKVLLIFIISTMSIVLYDMYINIEVEEDSYSVDRISKETNIESVKNEENVSQMLENVSDSVVRNI